VTGQDAADPFATGPATGESAPVEPATEILPGIPAATELIPGIPAATVPLEDAPLGRRAHQTSPELAPSPLAPPPLAPSAAAAAGGSAGGDGGGKTPSGFLGTIAKHPQAWLIAALAVAFVLLGTGAVFAGINTASASPADAAAPLVTATQKAKATTPPPRPVPANPAAATRLRTCSIAGPAADGRLGAFEGSIINAKTGEVLFDRKAGTPAATASVMKTVIAASALATIGPDYQMSTKVVAGADPATIVLVGGGDPTLSALPAGASVYRGAPTLADLAAQVKTKLAGTEVTHIVLDASMWNVADAWDPSWPANERTLGFQPLIVPLMVDGDRANGRVQTSPRGTDPVGHAGQAFRAAMGLPDSVELTVGTAPAGGAVLAEVKSQPIRTLIGQMLPNSDNTLAEMMARVTSKAVGRDGSAASLTSVVAGALAKYSITAPGLVIKDGSGESKNDAVAPQTIAQLMVQVLTGAKGLDAIYTALPVSGKTGTLASRFTGANAIARGAVNAKTGSIANVYTLGGIIHAKDGTPLAFAFFALNSRSTAMAAIDTVATAAFGCGDNLSNN
jgi:D-alanyl-D-alanine carboxypeptidase/D-alanyl-D-alanine-endopeptidase (penicillin-binding protein 4)